MSITKEKIEEIGDYIKDFEKGLYEWDYDHVAMQTEYGHINACVRQWPSDS